jgi:hypothetical protein
MSLDLICGNRELGRLQQLLGRGDGEVTNSQASNLARMNELLERGPGIGDRNIG